MKKISIILLPAILWLTLLLLIGLNLWLKHAPPPPDWPLRLNVLRYPASSDYHSQLAEFYWQQRLPTLGSHEIAIAETLRASPVLGATHYKNQIDPQSLLSTWQTEIDNLNSQYTYWQEVIRGKPDYRDAYLVLGRLALRLGQEAEAVRWFNLALNIDPNYSLTVEILQKISTVP